MIENGMSHRKSRILLSFRISFWPKRLPLLSPYLGLCHWGISHKHKKILFSDLRRRKVIHYTELRNKLKILNHLIFPKPGLFGLKILTFAIQRVWSSLPSFMLSPYLLHYFIYHEIKNSGLHDCPASLILVSRLLWTNKQTNKKISWSENWLAYKTRESWHP